MKNYKKIARIAGAWYLAFIFLGAFSVMFIDDSLTVVGDASATIKNLRTNQTLFLFGIIAYIAGYVCFIFVANNLSKLFNQSNSYTPITPDDRLSVPPYNRLIILMKIFVYSGVALALACKVSQVIAAIFSNIKYLVFYETGSVAASIFWGLWLFPLGLLIFKSGLMPKTIGALLLGACAANLVEFLLLFIAPNTPEAILTVCYIVGMKGEFSLVLWLLIKGVNNKNERDATLYPD